MKRPFRRTPTQNLPIDDLEKLQLFLNLVPIFGVFPALWTLYVENAQGPVRSVSRLAVTLALTWLIATILLAGGASAHFSHLATLRFWLAAGFVGSGYFALNLVLMLRVLQRKPVKLPGLSGLSKRLP
jgi:hypothetical protein